MAVLHVQSAQGNGSNTATLNLPSVAAASAILVYIRVLSNDAFTVTDDRNGSYTELSGPSANGSIRLRVFYKMNVQAGTTNVTASCVNFPTFRVVAAEYSGGDLTAIIGNTNFVAFSTNTTITATNVATTLANSLVVGMIGANASATSIAPHSGETERQEVDNRLQVQDKAAATVTNYSNSWTFGTTQPGIWWQIVLNPSTSSNPPSITSVDSDNIVTSTQTGVVILGSDLGASPTVQLIDGSTTQTLSVTSFSPLTVDMSLGSCRYGSRTIKVINGALSGTKTITVNPPSGYSYIDLATLLTLVNTTRNTPNRIYDSPDISSGSQVEYRRLAGTGAVTIFDNGRLTAANTVTQLEYRWNAGTSWSGLSTWDMADLFPLFIGPAYTNVTTERLVTMTPLIATNRFTNEALGTVSYSSSGTALPAGVTINSSSGTISGTPTVAATTTGLKVRLTDTSGHYAESGTFSMSVENAPTPPEFHGPIANTTGVVGQNFSYELFSNFLYSDFFLASSVPGGLTFDTLNCKFTGMPTTPGTYTGHITASGPEGPNVVSNDFDIVIQNFFVDVPNVIGKTVTQAIADIVAQGLIAFTIEIVNGSVSEGFVFDQSPSASALVTPGSTVTLYVSDGAQPVVIETGAFAFDPTDKQIKTFGVGGFGSAHPQRPPASTGTDSATPKKTPALVAPATMGSGRDASYKGRK